MPKVIVSGRGGSGKSTLTSLLAEELSVKGKVLVLDADESNLGLGAMLGMKNPDKTIMEELGGKPAVFEKMKVLFKSDFKEKPRFFESSFSIESLPADAVSDNGKIRFSRIGKIEHSMEGCACPMGAVAKGFLNSIETDKDEWVLVDTEAGVEHFGRGLLEGADIVLIVVDPSRDAVLIAKKAAELAAESGKIYHIVFNKTDDKTEKLLREMLDENGMKALVAMPYAPYISSSNLKGEPLSHASLKALLHEIIAEMENN